MKYTHMVCPNDATGQHGGMNAFAYNNDGKRCMLIGRGEYADDSGEYGMRQKVELENGECGYVWEDELVRVCAKCNEPEWDCGC